ncbi:amidohydrolase family protein [Leptothoe sp. PORK10 BA2]|uniref:amidohydrolase family protein n=1 Tax=Leptothoe sp. PORK10 BA2 TaxID=3110254 RepID=UPI002B1ECC11|nr:amidohydrolase family protein [Leptothoe sp. PORK10 BA2]MEA5462431.1 amidohydrolase family protein [Leptothoe sp. PORK10 BA2]
MLTLKDCIVLHGKDLRPYQCHQFTVEQDTITHIDLGSPCNQLEQGSLVIIPGLYNSHTHMGDSCLPDGTTGMTLEEGFFRPNGYKYRELGKQTEAEHLEHLVAHLRYMARTGTVGHIDFREQGVYGSQLLRQAADKTGVNSVILGQFNQLPFTESQLQENRDGLSDSALAELDALLTIADGFSESTMNDLTDLAWQQIYLRSQHKLRAIHCLENEGYRDTSLAVTGRGDLERALELYQPHLVIHATVANAAEIGMLSAHRVNVVLNPRANANLGLPLPPIAPLLQSQANLLLGTDNGLLNSPNMLAELDFTYKVAKSQFGSAALRPDPVDILKMATSNLHGVLGQDIYGYLEVGLPADFAVLNFRQPHLRATRHILASIVSRTTPDDVLATVRQGQVLYQDPTFALAA